MVEESLEKMEDRLNLQASQAVHGTARDAGTTAVARRIEDLLSIPLEDTPLRIKLLETLERTGKVLDDAKTEKKIADSHPAEVILAMQEVSQQQAGLESPWSRAIEQATLEAKLIDLADPNIAAEFEKVIPPANELRDRKRRQIRKLSPSLRAVLSGPAAQIDSTHESAPRRTRIAAVSVRRGHRIERQPDPEASLVYTESKVSTSNSMVPMIRSCWTPRANGPTSRERSMPRATSRAGRG